MQRQLLKNLVSFLIFAQTILIIQSVQETISVLNH